MAVLEERVYNLEQMMAEVAQTQTRTEISLNRLAKDVSDFKTEMTVFKDEMLAFKNEAQLDRKRMNRAWGDLANKPGTITQDIVTPNINRMALTESARPIHLES